MDRRFNPEFGANQGAEFKAKERPKSEIEKQSLSELESFFESYIQPNIDKNQIDEEEFSEVYTPEEIATDLESMQKRKVIFEKALRGSNLTPEAEENRRKLDILAKQFEAMCSDHTILARGLGMRRGEIRAQSASEFDDIVNKMDIFLEFSNAKNGSKEVGDFSMGIDVTISKNSFIRKFEDLYRSFDRFPLGRARYFRESADGITNARLPVNGEVHLPRYIINAHPDELIELMDGWKMWRDNFKPTSSTKEKLELLQKTHLTESKIWYRILYQLERQAYEFSDVFKDSDPKASQMYRQNYMLFAKARYQLTLKYIDGNKEWQDRLIDIKTLRDDKEKQPRFDLLRREVHEASRGEGMSDIIKIIKGQIKQKHAW